MRLLHASAIVAAMCLLCACGGGPAEEAAVETGTTPGAEAVQVVETQEVLTSTPVPAPFTGAIGEARETAAAANAHVQSIDSIMSGQ